MMSQRLSSDVKKPTSDSYEYYNILLRKNCEHKDKFICECDFPPFDVLVSDFDYCHEINTVINKPKSMGTEVFQTPSMRDTRMKIATPLLDLFGLLLTVARIRSRMGSNYKGCSKMVEGWKEIVLSGGQLDYMLSEMFSESLKVKTTLESLAHTSEMHKCDECKALKDQIATVARHINPEKKGISKFTTDTWKLGTNFCEYFLICIFVDMDSELLKYLIDTLNDILKDYKVTFEENQV